MSYLKWLYNTPYFYLLQFKSILHYWTCIFRSKNHISHQLLNPIDGLNHFDCKFEVHAKSLCITIGCNEKHSPEALYLTHFCLHSLCFWNKWMTSSEVLLIVNMHCQCFLDCAVLVNCKICFNIVSDIVHNDS